MKKENKIMAQERRAKERKKTKRKERFVYFMKFWFPVIVVVAVIILLVWAIATSGGSDTNSDTDVDTTNTEISSDILDNSQVPTLNTEAGLIAEDGDTVNIDYTGYLDGTAFEGGSTNGMGADLGLGTHTYIEGFEEGIVGKAVGDTFDLNLTFPEDYGNTELAGKEVVFTVTLNGIYE